MSFLPNLGPLNGGPLSFTGTAQSQVILGGGQLTPIENVDRYGASVADGRPISHPDNDGG
jgi:hypothetical protein